MRNQYIYLSSLHYRWVEADTPEEALEKSVNWDCDKGVYFDGDKLRRELTELGYKGIAETRVKSIGLLVKYTSKVTKA